MGFGNIKIKVNGKTVKVNVDEVLMIDDVGTDMNKVAAQIAYWGAVWAAAEAESHAADSYYRKWRANKSRQLLANDGKLAEWKVRQEVESDSEFAVIKKGLATAIHNSILCRAIFDAFKIKANMLQSRGAMMRAEHDATGMSTPRKKKTSEEDKKAENKAAVKKIFLKKKKKKTE